MTKRNCFGYAVLAAFAVASVTVPAPFADAREKLRDRLRERLAERMGADEGPKAPGSETISYGSDALQTLDVWRAKNAQGPAPLVVFVHGGGWKRGSKDNATGQYKPMHYPGDGYAFASIDYRLVPDATVEQQAADVASAVKALIDRVDSLGIDRRRIVIMGHSAGAHLVALVGTDEKYLRAAGLSFADVAGVIPIDGAAYDITRTDEGRAADHAENIRSGVRGRSGAAEGVVTNVTGGRTQYAAIPAPPCPASRRGATGGGARTGAVCGREQSRARELSGRRLARTRRNQPAAGRSVLCADGDGRCVVEAGVRAVGTA